MGAVDWGDGVRGADVFFSGRSAHVYKPDVIRVVSCHMPRGKKKRRDTTPLPPDVDTYTIGESWTESQRMFLAVFFAAINSAAEKVRYDCVTSVREFEVGVKVSHTGDGVFPGKDVPIYTHVGYYYGVVENARKFKDDGYSMGLPPIKFPDGTSVPAVLSGYGSRLMEGSASMFNHSCQKFNAQFLLQDVVVSKNIEARMEVQRLLEKPGSVVPDSLLEAAGEVLYNYPVVIVMTDRAVEAGEELRVTYNRDKSAYFSTRRNALRSAGKGYCIAKCMCEPGGCPLKRFYVTARAKAVVLP